MDPTRQNANQLGGLSCADWLLSVSSGLPGVVDELAVDGVGDASFEAAEGFFAALAFAEFALVVVVSGAVVSDLGDRGHVDGVVDAPVSCSGESVSYRVGGRHFDWCGSGVAGEVVA